jgi:hypothetical protein
MHGSYGLTGERGRRGGEESVSEVDKIALTAWRGTRFCRLDIASLLRDGFAYDAPDPHLPDHHY